LLLRHAVRSGVLHHPGGLACSPRLVGLPQLPAVATLAGPNRRRDFHHPLLLLPHPLLEPLAQRLPVPLHYRLHPLPELLVPTLLPAQPLAHQQSLKTVGLPPPLLLQPRHSPLGIPPILFRLARHPHHAPHR